MPDSCACPQQGAVASRRWRTSARTRPSSGPASSPSPRVGFCSRRWRRSRSTASRRPRRARSARGAGMSPAAVYVHYKSKSDLLYEISRIGHQSVLDVVEEALRDAPQDPERTGSTVRRRLREVARRPPRRRARHPVRAEVAPAEAVPQDRRAAQALRGAARGELEAGVEAGAFDIAELEATTLAILSLCIDLARWYHPSDDHKTSDEVGELYADLVARMILPITAARRRGRASGRSSPS